MTKTTERALEHYLKRVGSAVEPMHQMGAGSVATLEEKLKNFYQMDYALCVSNATSGLLAVALALNLKHSDFVTTPYTYGASLAGWLMLGNRPIFSDIDAATQTLASGSVRRAVNSRTKALLGVDIFGHPSDTLALRRLADEFGLWYVADAAQSLGAYRNDKPASYLADALVVSFTTGKTIFAGEGGAVLTRNPELYQKLIWFSQHPARQHRDLGLRLDNEFALNARIHPLAAVWANAQFEAALVRLSLYQRDCFKTIDALNDIGLTEPITFARDEIKPSFFRLTAKSNKKSGRRKLAAALSEYGISADIQESPVSIIYEQPAFLAQFGRRYCLPHRCYEAERQARNRFCLRLENGGR